MAENGIPSLQEIRNFASQYRFSERETEVFLSLVDKQTTAEAIGVKLGVSPNTVSNHFKNILRKTGTPNKSALLSLYLVYVIKQLRHCKMFERKPRVLIVDDEPDICEILHEDLHSRGVHVVSYTDPKKALNAVRELKLDFVVSDIRMPSLDGVNFLSGLREFHRYHPILLFMSGFAQYRKDELMHLGAVECFEKPLDPERVFLTIMRYFIESPSETDKLIDFEAAVAAREAATLEIVTVNNLGFGGVFIPMDSSKLAADDRFSCGEHIEVTIKLKDSVSAPIRTKGEVVWRRPESEGSKASGIGVRFLNLNVNDRDRIEAFVRENKVQSFIPMGALA